MNINKMARFDNIQYIDYDPATGRTVIAAKDSNGKLVEVMLPVKPIIGKIPGSRKLSLTTDTGTDDIKIEGNKINLGKKKPVKHRKGGIVKAKKTITKKKKASVSKSSATKWENKWG